MATNHVGINLPGATRPAKSLGHTSAPIAPSEAPGGRFCRPPADLAGFMKQTAVRGVAEALGVSYRQAQRMSVGYWPSDARAILRAWDAYKGRSASQISHWFLRRVHPGGVVLHADGRWSANGLVARVGQQLAVARGTGGLLAQTLELPPQRFELVPVEGAAA